MADKKAGKKQEASWGADDEALVAVDETEIASLVQEHTKPDEIKALLANGDMITTKFIPMREGMEIQGYFLGAGGTIEMNDPQHAGVKRPVGTWLFKHPTANVRLKIASSVNLDSQLGGVELGTFVIVQKGGQNQVGARRVNDFNVFISTKKFIDVARPAAQPTA